VYPDPTPLGPRGADAQAAIPTQTPQDAEASAQEGIGLRADAQRRQWRARLACGHDVEVTDVSPGDPQPPTSVECPRCGQRQPVEIYPLTALSDPDNVQWVREDDR
jgi:hypothetical protein